MLAYESNALCSHIPIPWDLYSFLSIYNMYLQAHTDARCNNGAARSLCPYEAWQLRTKGRFGLSIAVRTKRISLIHDLVIGLGITHLLQTVSHTKK
jgi:hypothetical protein